MVDTEDLTGISISSWVDTYSVPEIKYLNSFNFKIHRIDGETYITHTSRPAFATCIKTYKLTYNGTEIVPEPLFCKGNENSEIISVLSINDNLATILKENVSINVYLHTTDKSGKLLYTGLLSDYTVVESINTWTDNGVGYISAIVDYTKIIVGKFDANNKWNVISTYDTGGRVLDLEVKMGRSYPYATWRSTANKMTLAVFNYANSSKSSWSTLATLNSVKSSQLSVESYTSPYTGILSEDVYVGVIGATYNEFQLYKLNSYNQLGRIGDYILNIPNDYNFVNYKGLIVLAHLSSGMETPLTFNSISEKWSSSASIYSDIKELENLQMQAILFDNAAALMLDMLDDEGYPTATIYIGKK